MAAAGPSCIDSASRAMSNSPERPSTLPARSRRRSLIDGITIVGELQAQILAIRVDDGWDATDIFAVSEALGRGWYLDRQNNPDSLHATVSNGNAPVADEFTDLADAVAETLGTTTDDRDTAYATVD